MSVRPTLSVICAFILLLGFAAFAGFSGMCKAGPAMTRPVAAKSALPPAKSPAAAPAPAATANAPSAAGASRVAADVAADKQPYIWRAVRSGNTVKLRGSVPSDDDRQTIIGMTKAHFPDLSIDDGLKIVKGAPPQEQWLGAVSFALKQLGYLDRGNVQLDDVALSVTGIAKSAKDYDDIRRSLFGPLPTGLTLQNETIVAPRADPFVFTAELKGNMLTLSGDVPADAVHSRLKQSAKQMFADATLDDKLVLASGAPKKWDAAAIAALTALSMLDEGKVTLSGADLTIDGTAPDKSTATQISYQLKQELPSVFTSSENIRWKEAESEPDTANQLIPRIKRIVDTGALAMRNALPTLDPGQAR
jgi:hypothetical protein